MTFLVNRRSQSSLELKGNQALPEAAVNTTGRRKAWVNFVENFYVCMDVKTKDFFCLTNALMS